MVAHAPAQQVVRLDELSVIERLVLVLDELFDLWAVIILERSVSVCFDLALRGDEELQPLFCHLIGIELIFNELLDNWHLVRVGIEIPYEHGGHGRLGL